MKTFASILAAMAAVTALATTTDARADEGLHQGLDVGLRLGYGIPLGDAQKDVKLSDGIKGKIPIQVDVGYRVLPALYVGAYFEYAFGLLASKTKDACDALSVDCSAHALRFGGNVQYHFMTEGSVLPWAGVGVGYEIATTKVADASTSIKGLEFVNLQLGADFIAAPNLRVGPMVNFSLGQYSTVSGDGDATGDIKDKAIHEWLTIGIRGAYNL